MLNKNLTNNRKRNTEECLEETELIELIYKKFQFHSSTKIRLVKTTKRYNTYCLSTPEGIRAIKATLLDNITIDTIKNL